MVQRRQQSRGFTIVVLSCLLALGAACTGQQADPTGGPAPGGSAPGGSAPGGSAPSGSAVGASSAGPSSLAEQLQTQVETYLSAGGRYEELINGIVLNVDGRDLVAHYRSGSGAKDAHNVYSVTKTVMSMLIGIAIEERRIRSVDATLAEVLPQYVGVMAEGVEEVTVRQLLTMTGGLTPDERTGRYGPHVDWTKLTLSTPLRQPPGQGFVYSSPGAHLLSAILARATGMSVLDYARAKLFDPLGISTHPAEEPASSVPDLPAYDARTGFGWSTDPQGLHLGLADLKITVPDMVKLGRLYLDEGRWDGHQLVPARWVRESTRSQVTVDDTPDGSVGYGYLWWIPPAHEHPAYAAMGYAGQLIHVVPDLGLVVAVSCQDAPDSFEATNFIDFIDRQVIPVMTG